MLSDLTFDMCVPSLRWSEAHRMQRKTPSWKVSRQYLVVGLLGFRQLWIANWAV